MDNQAFWNERYRRLPWLGSGPGSRGLAQQYKADLVRVALARNIHSILDIGCGDLCWLRTKGLSVEDLAGVGYMGVDISDVVIARNRDEYLRFDVFDLSRDAAPLAADLVLCFDVLLHQTSRELFDACLRNLLACIGNMALVSYRNPERPVEPVRPPLGNPDDEAETRFRKRLAAHHATRTDAGGATAYFGEFAALVAAVPGRAHRVRWIGDYNFQSVYEIHPETRLE